MMRKEQVTITGKEPNSETGIKIIEWNVSDPAESVYAVVTPVKLK